MYMYFYLTLPLYIVTPFNVFSDFTNLCSIFLYWHHQCCDKSWQRDGHRSTLGTQLISTSYSESISVLSLLIDNDFSLDVVHI